MCLPKKKITAAGLFIGIIILITMAANSLVFANPASPFPIETELADGSVINIYRRGDEFFNWQEDEDGFIVAFDNRNSEWRYAAIDEIGAIVPGTEEVGKSRGDRSSRITADDIVPLLENVDRSSNRVRMIYDYGTKLFNAPGLTANASGLLNRVKSEQPLLVMLLSYQYPKIPVNYADHGNTMTFWSDHFFADSGRTVNNYFNEISGNSELRYIKPVFKGPNVFEVPKIINGTTLLITIEKGIVKVHFSKNHPMIMNPPNQQTLDDDVKMAFNAVKEYIDFTGINKTDDMILCEDFNVITVVAGYEGSSTDKSPSVWAHTKRGYIIENDLEKNVSIDSSNNLISYAVQGEMYHDGSPMTVGVTVHELGHLLGLPDLYSYLPDGDGIGPYSVMSIGSWGTEIFENARRGDTPTHLDAWSKIKLGFIIPDLITSDEYADTAEVSNIVNNNYNALKITSDVDDKQYFLVENRQREFGYDRGLNGLSVDGEGILIYHIDERVYETYQADKTGGLVNDNNYHKTIDIEKYSNYPYGMININHSPFYISGDVFDNFTTPNSNFHSSNHLHNPAAHTDCCGQDVASGVQINVLSPPGATMRVEVGASALTGVAFTAAQVGGVSQITDSAGVQITFDIEVTSLSAGDIIITDGVGSVVTGALSGSGRVYTLALTNILTEGYITVGVNDFGTYEVTTAPQSVEVYKYFAPVLVNAAAINGVIPPVAGAVPSLSINGGEGFTPSISWDGSPDVFEYAKIYSATITLTASAGYTFGGGYGDSDAITGFTTGGIAPVWVKNNGSELVFTVTFPATSDAAPLTILNVPIVFLPVDAGYTISPAAARIIIYNPNSSAVRITGVSLTGDGAHAFDLGGSGSYIEAEETLETLTVRPKIGLGAGTYEAAVTIEYDGLDGNSVTADISFKVAAIPQDAFTIVYPGEKIYNGPDFVLSATGGSGTGAVSYSLISGPASVSPDGAVKILGADTIAVLAVKAGDGVYGPITSPPMLIAVRKSAQPALSIVDPGNKSFGDAPFILTATGGGGTGAVVYALVSGPALIAPDGTVTATSAGTVVVSAYKAGDDNYEPSTGARLFFIIDRSHQKDAILVAWPDPQIKTYKSDAVFRLSATGGNGTGTVSFKLISGPAVVTSGGRTTVTGAGEIIVAAVKTGDVNFYGAESADFTITVDKTEYDGVRSIEINMPYGASGAYSEPLPAPPDGSVYGRVTSSGALGLVATADVIDNRKINLMMNGAPYPDKHDLVQTLAIPVTGARNYNDYVLSVDVRILKPEDMRENTPFASIDYPGERLIDLKPGGAYMINGEEISAGADGSITIKPDWFGRSLSIVKKNVDGTYSNSGPQILFVPDRPGEVPAGLVATDAYGGMSNGTISGVDVSMEYRAGSASSWTIISADELINLRADMYHVRYFATDYRFASEYAVLVIASSDDAAVPESTPDAPGVFNGGGSESESDVRHDAVRVPPKTFDELLSESAARYGGAVEWKLSVLRPEIIITKKQLDTIVESGTSLIIKQGNMTLVVPPPVFAEDDFKNSNNVVISVKPANDELKNGYAKSFGGSNAALNKALLSHAVEIKIIADGTEVKKFATPLSMKFTLPDISMNWIQARGLTVVRFTDTGIERLGDIYDAASKTISSETTSLSAYGVMCADNLIKLRMTIGVTNYTVNGLTKNGFAAPTIINGRTMVPARYFAEAFGAKVDWDDGAKTASFALGGRTLGVVIGEAAPEMDVPASIINGRTMVPFRYIGEKLGINVIWDDGTKTVRAYK